jgi:hypothetical protein
MRDVGSVALLSLPERRGRRATGIAGSAIGAKYFLTDSTAVVARYRYEWFFDDVTFKDATDTSDGSHVFTVALSDNW